MMTDQALVIRLNPSDDVVIACQEIPRTDRQSLRAWGQNVGDCPNFSVPWQKNRTVPFSADVLSPGSFSRIGALATA